MKNVPDRIIQQTKEAIQRFRRQNRVRWKPYSAERHLRKRIIKKHLPTGTTMAAYEARILQTIQSDEAIVYAYLYDNRDWYATVVEFDDEEIWVVLFSFDTVMETAFRLDIDPEDYLSEQRGYFQLGQVSEVLKWTN